MAQPQEILDRELAKSEHAALLAAPVEARKSWIDNLEHEIEGSKYLPWGHSQSRVVDECTRKIRIIRASLELQGAA